MFSAVLAATPSHSAGQGTDQGDQEEPQEVQRSVQRQGQDAPQQGQQGIGKQNNSLHVFSLNI